MTDEVGLWREGHPTIELVTRLGRGDVTMPDLVRFNQHMVECVACFEGWRTLTGKAYQTPSMDAR